VVCDVSGKNPNVMFELGMRLAFDKPTIIIKDDKTAYSFDTSPIEHLEYPRDLRFSKIVAFKESLKEKIIATLKKSQEDPHYTAFLKHFGTFTVAKLDTKELSKEDYIIEELKDLKKTIRNETLKNMRRSSSRFNAEIRRPFESLDFESFTKRNVVEKIGQGSLIFDSEEGIIKKFNDLLDSLPSQYIRDMEDAGFFDGGLNSEGYKFLVKCVENDHEEAPF